MPLEPWQKEALFDVNAPQPAGQPKVIDSWREAIECPSCSLKQFALVLVYDDMPFAAYVHVCACGYTITESEWQYVNYWEVGKAAAVPKL